MSEKRRALGRGLGALIPSAPPAPPARRPGDLLFKRVDPEQDGMPAAFADPAEPTSPANGAMTPTDRPDPGGAGSDGGVSTVEPRDLAPVPGVSFAELPIAAIRPNPRQPRSAFDEDELVELAHSIREIGLLQPVIVRPVPAAEQDDDGVRFELVVGERRWRASKLAGRQTVPAIVKETQDDSMLRDALLENLHRSQLNALEEAAAYQQLLDDFGCTHEVLAARIGRSRPQISNTIRLLKLPAPVARRVAAGIISAGHARALLTLDDPAAMERLAQRIVAEGLSVRTVEELVAVGADAPAARPRQPRAGTRHPQLDEVAARLGDQLETRVAIALGRHKGKVTIEFASVEDLNRILDAMGLQNFRN